MNNLDKQYQALLQDILDNGVKKKDRTGTGTISVFGRQIRHKMSEGFPLLTTKKMAWKQIVTELLWFLRGDTNIKFLVDNGCHIWDGDAWTNYQRKVLDKFMNDTTIANYAITNKEEFINKIKTDDGFARKWGELGPIYGAGWRNWGGDAYKNYLNVEGKKFHESTKELRKWATVEGPFGPGGLLTQVEFINKIKTDEEFAKKWGELGPIYGKQWRSWKTDDFDLRPVEGHPTMMEANDFKYIDQIQNLINELKTNPDSRRLMVNSWNVGEISEMVLPPCHYGFQVYTRELSQTELNILYNKRRGVGEVDTKYTIGTIIAKDPNIQRRAISLMWNQRSVDTFLGLPFNIASYGLLLEIIAEAVNMVPDELIGNLGDTHLYSNHVEQAKEQISRTPYELPKLNINTEFWPYEGGECGEGPLDANAIFEGFKNEHFCKCLLEEDIQLYDYNSHPTIKAPLSN